MVVARHTFLNSGGGAVVYPFSRIISGILPSNQLLRIWFQNFMDVLVFFFFFFFLRRVVFEFRGKRINRISLHLRWTNLRKGKFCFFKILKWNECFDSLVNRSKKK